MLTLITDHCRAPDLAKAPAARLERPVPRRPPHLRGHGLWGLGSRCLRIIWPKPAEHEPLRRGLPYDLFLTRKHVLCQALHFLHSLGIVADRAWEDRRERSEEVAIVGCVPYVAGHDRRARPDR